MTDKAEEATPPKLEVVPNMKYNPDEVTQFLRNVFHTKLIEGEETLTWSTSGIPGYPTTPAQLTKKLGRAKKPLACYFGTSTCYRSEDGNLYNRKALFCRLHVVVLDDIGTKINKADLPEGLEPSYIIESSAGNEQWGFILEEPIDNLDHAQTFVSLVYSSGYTDAGGNMPTKLVRLPAGFNMKKGQEDMPVKLIKSDGPLWTPDNLLQSLNINTTWQDIVDDAEQVRKTRLCKVQGTTLWSPVPLMAPTVDGIVDPALEWMYDEGTVYQERDQWVDIQCPWHGEHTEKGPGKDNAGYSPMGWGEGVYQNSRGFNCFHNSCETRGPSEFLEFVAVSGGPELSVHDRYPELASTYVHDMRNDGVWNVKDISKPRYLIKMPVLKRMQHKIKVITFDGSVTRINPVDLWLKEPHTIHVDGTTWDAADRSVLVKSAGALRVNTFRMPYYEPGPVDMENIQPFIDHVAFLIPDQDERAYYWEWLACKIQYPEFRGAAIVMVAGDEGVGRSLISKVLQSVLGIDNVTEMDQDELLKPSGGFNDHLKSVFITVDETLADSTTRDQMKAYTALKTLIDPSLKHAVINTKYGSKEKVRVSFSLQFLSNHNDGAAMFIPNGTEPRRFYVITNPVVPHPDGEEYYGNLHDWVDEGGYERDMWNYLTAIPTDFSKMSAPAPITAAMKDIQDHSTRDPDRLARAVLDAWPYDIIPPVEVMSALVWRMKSVLNIDESDRHSQTEYYAAFEAAFRKTTQGSYGLTKPRPRIGGIKLPTPQDGFHAGGGMTNRRMALMKDVAGEWQDKDAWARYNARYRTEIQELVANMLRDEELHQKVADAFAEQ
ncbi:MAG: DUF5906 domain-containing protein [Halioglobus sp.]